MLEVNKLVAKRSDSFSLTLPKLSVAGGSVLCVAGPNGSGKTTLIECLAGLLTPTDGTITIAGQPVSHDLKAPRAVMGFVPDDEDWLIKELSAREYFRLLIDIYKDAGVRTDMSAHSKRLADRLRFTAFDQPLASLSHGNKKKVQIIAGLMHQPKLIILDELRNGLDPIAIIAAEQLVRDEAKRGACVIAATHDLWWAQRIAKEILLLVDGKPAVHLPTSRIVKKYGSVEKLFIETVQLGSYYASV